MNPKVLLISFNYSKCYYSDHLHFIAALVGDNIYVRHLVIEWYSQNMWELIQESIKNEKSNVIYFLCDNFDIISSDLAHYYGQKIKENFGDRVNIGIQSHYDKYFQRNLGIGQYYLGGAQGFSSAVKSFKDTCEMLEGEYRVVDIGADYKKYILDFDSLQYFTLESESFCKYTCSFCYKSDNTPVRNIDFVQVDEYLKVAKRLGFSNVWFLDPTINENKNLKGLMFLLQSHKNFKFIFEVRPESFSYETYTLFLQLSNIVFNAGLQSISLPVSKSIQRRFDKTAYMTGITLMKKLGKVNIDIILGLPQETKVSFLSTYSFANNLQISSIRIFLLENRPNSFVQVSHQGNAKFSTEYPYKLISSNTLSEDSIRSIKEYFLSQNVDFN